MTQAVAAPLSAVETATSAALSAPGAGGGSGSSGGAGAPPPGTLVHTLSDLVAHFERGCKPSSQLQIGVEHEKIAVALDADGSVRPVPYEDAAGRPQIRALLQGLQQHGWQPVFEKEHVIALKRSGASVTLEPGGQFELSGRPFATEIECADDVDAHLADLLPIGEQNQIAFLGCGFRPLGTWDDVSYMPKGRYRVMREYLPTRGSMGVEMMKRTATVQANLDFVSEADAVAKMRLSLGLAPLVTALYAASPLVDGKVSSYQSYRAACWLDTDNSRCGILPFMFEEGAGFAQYAEWALDVPMFFVYRHGTYTHVPDLTFRRFMAEGYREERATLADWELHLSTMFPDARLKQYVEVRSADAGPMEMIRGLGALWRGLFYDQASLQAAWELVKDWSAVERETLRQQIPQQGMKATVRGHNVGALCEQMVRIAMAGERSLGATAGVRLLEPLLQRAVERRSPADDILDAFASVGGNPRAFVEKIRYR